MMGRLLTSIASIAALLVSPVTPRTMHDKSVSSLQVGGQSVSAANEKLQTVLALEEQMESLQRANADGNAQTPPLPPSDVIASWSEPFPAYKIVGNIYYVGSRGLASYLITTPRGHILINSNLESSVPQIRDSVEKLGFHFSDVKILLISHAHWDHAAGSAEIKKLTGAQYMVMDGDVLLVNSGGKSDFLYGNSPATLFPLAKVDRILHDGDEVSLGGARLTAHLTPGHTKGCTTWTVKANEAGKSYNVVIVGSPNVNPGYKLVKNPQYPEIASEYEKMFRVLKQLPCDIFLGAHGSYYHMEAKFAQLKNGGVNPFVDPEGYKSYVAEREQAFRSELAKQTAAEKGEALPGSPAAAQPSAEQEVLALEDQMDALLRSNSEARIALWADDLVYITNKGAVLDKTRVAEQVSTAQVHVESLEVTERKVRVYGDVAVVTALERMRASYHGKETRDQVQRYTRVWARRGGNWQIALFQATGVTSTPNPHVAGVEACSSEAMAETSPATSAADPESVEQMILRLEDELSDADIKGHSTARFVGDDYVAIAARGGLGDKAFAKRLYGPGGVRILWEKKADERVRVFGDKAIVTGIWCLRSVRDGKESAGAMRFSHVWVKRNANWQVVSWQGTPIVPREEFAPGSTPVGQDDANRAEDETAIRKLIADHNAAFDKHDGSANLYFTDDADTRNIEGKFFAGKAEIEKLNVALDKSFANAKRTETIQRIRFLTPDLAMVDSSGEWTGYILTEDGTKLTPPKGGMSFKVVVKKDGRWLITAMRNAMAVGPAAPSSVPGTGTPNPQAQDAPTTPDDTNHAQDEAAIRKIVADNIDAWNRRDAKAQVAHFSEDIDHIGVQGLWRSNRAQLEKGFTAGFPTTRNGVSGSVERIRFLTPDVAVVVVRREYVGEFRDSTGHDKESRKAISTSIFHKVNGNWLIEAFQNTYVRPPESSPLPTPREPRE
jgi:metallo-beta-lactamase class B